MNEAFLHYIWKNRYFEDLVLTTQSDTLTILDVGEPNSDSGPDFFNAKIKINETIWVGNIEIHINGSDWYRHGHQLDGAYDNIILHLVLNPDKEVKRVSGEPIPTAVLSFDFQLYDFYLALMNSQRIVPCQDWLTSIAQANLESWLNQMLVERLEQKGEEILNALHRNKNNWEEMFYQKMARGFGYRANADAFELLARSIPLKLLAKKQNDNTFAEAILFGQAGFLNDPPKDDYTTILSDEFRFLRIKHGLSPLSPDLWKFSRMRPNHFPTLRIAQFAAFMANSDKRFSDFMEMEDLDEIIGAFRVSINPYWETHYRFGKATGFVEKNLGIDMIRTLLINVLVPVMFAYGLHKDERSLQTRAIEILSKLPAERNRITKDWRIAGIDSKNAITSQALIQLNKEYCIFKRCLFCQIGNLIIS